MLKEQEMELTRQKNYHQIRELMRISMGLGVNLYKPTRFKESLKIVNFLLVVFSCLSLWHHWLLLVKFINNVEKIGETVCTALQATISVVKMVYYLFRQRRMAKLLQCVVRQDLLRQIEIFHKDFPDLDNLKREIDDIMAATWRRIRFEILFYTFCCIAICTNYFSYAVINNLYHQLKGTPDYVFILPLTGYPVWPGESYASPYYYMEMFMSACGLYLAGMCAVSFDGLFIVLSQHGVALIQVLNKLFLHSTSASVPRERRVEYLRYCIRQYQRVFDYIDELNELYMHVSLSQFMQSLIVLGFVLFEIDVGLEGNKVVAVRMIMYMAAAGQQLVIYCTNGQRLTSATDEISLALYDCEWYNESREFRQLLYMMLIRANRLSYCKISWFATMSLGTLMAMFKASGSYFLLLRDLSH